MYVLNCYESDWKAGLARLQRLPRAHTYNGPKTGNVCQN